MIKFDRKTTWRFMFAALVLFWILVIISIISLARAATDSETLTLPKGAERIPFIEFSCEKSKEVVFYDDGKLRVADKVYVPQHYAGDLMTFSEGTTLKGETEGDHLYFDNSVLTVNGVSEVCHAQ